LEDRFAIVRTDHLHRTDCKPFGVVGRDYEPLQNRDAFRFFDPLLREGHVTFETAGALGQGKRVWVLARFKGDVKIGPDELQRYLLLANTHNGTGSVTVKFTPVRVVCQNTLSAAVAGDGRAFRVRHDSHLQSRLREKSAVLDMIYHTYKQLQEGFQSMTRVHLQPETLAAYLKDVFPDPSKPDDQSARERLHRNRLAAAHFYQHGKGNNADGVRGTLWAAYNGVAEYVDHRKPNALAGDFSSSRLNYVWFGGGATIKQRALIQALRRSDPERLRTLALE
jgi:phage/plasmid-like protein (TIGR03299 family)